MRMIERTANIIRDLRSLTADDVLGPIGLQRVSSTSLKFMPLAGAFCAGAVIGGGVALMLAPMSGAELRGKILERAREMNAALSARLHASPRTNGSGEVRTEDASASDGAGSA